MKILQKVKDGGSDSNVTAYVLIEWKSVFSIMLLHFSDGSREAYHDHAFNAISWLLKGRLFEITLTEDMITNTIYNPSTKPIYTPKSQMHQVHSTGDSWVLTFRGPWQDEWHEYLPNEDKHQTLTHGRVVKNRS